MLKLPKNKVAVTPIFDPDTSPSGRIIIPDIAKERCDQGIVKYIGPDVKWVKQGMYVLFGGYTGTLIHLQGEGKLIVMPEEFVIAEIGEVENIHVPGLFFKFKVDKQVITEELFSFVLEGLLTDINIHLDAAAAGKLASKIAAWLVSNGVVGPIGSPYYQADYENIFEFISEAFRESDWYRGIVVKPERLKIEDYEQLGGNS